MFYRLSDYIGLAVEKVQVEVVLTVKVWLGHLSHTFAVAASVHVVLAMLSFCLIIHKHKFLNKTIGDSEKYSLSSWLLVLGGSLMITGVPLIPSPVQICLSCRKHKKFSTLMVLLDITVDIHHSELLI